MKLMSTLACGALLSFPTIAMASDPAPLDVPAKALPVPTADISPGMQKFIGAPLNSNWNKLWKTGEEARAFADVQAAATGTVIKNAQLRVTPVTYVNTQNFELVTRAKQASYVAAGEPDRMVVNIGDIGSEEPLDFYLNMNLVLPEDIKAGRRSFGKIELLGEVVSNGEKGVLRAGNIVVPFVDQLDPGAQPDAEGQLAGHSGL